MSPRTPSIRIRSEVPRTIQRLRIWQREVLELGAAELARTLAELMAAEIRRGAQPWFGAHERVLAQGFPIAENLPRAWVVTESGTVVGRPRTSAELSARTIGRYVVGHWLKLGTGQPGSTAPPPVHPIRRFLRWLKTHSPGDYRAEMRWYAARVHGGRRARGLFIHRIVGEHLDRAIKSYTLERRIRALGPGGFDPQKAYHFLLSRTRDIYAQWRQRYLDQDTARWWWLAEAGKPATGFPGRRYIAFALQRYRSRRAQAIREFAREVGGRAVGDRTVEVSLAQAVRIARRALGRGTRLQEDPLRRYGL